MKNKVTNYVIIVIFILCLYAPNGIFFFVKDRIEVINTENRNLATKPEFKISEITEYPNKYTEYYNDNLAFRSFIKQAWSNIYFDLFNESTDNRVVVGKNDGTKDTTWLFYNSKTDWNAVSFVRNEKPYSVEKLKSYKESIESNTKEFKDKGIDLYYLVVPNKSTVYVDFLPDNINMLDNENRTKQLEEYLMSNDIENFLYLDKALNDASEEYETYIRQDTHWNNYGAFIGVKALTKMIEGKDYFYNAKIQYNGLKKTSGDLINFSGLNNKEFKSSNITIDIGKEDAKIITEKNYTYAYNNKAEINKTVLLVGDSFRDSMIKYLASIYKEVIVLHRNNYESEYIIKYKPDIVIREFVERYQNDMIKKLELPKN